jgi:hypothetical protein
MDFLAGIRIRFVEFLSFEFSLRILLMFIIQSIVGVGKTMQVEINKKIYLVCWLLGRSKTSDSLLSPVIWVAKC